MQHRAKAPCPKIPGGCGHRPLNSAAALCRVCPVILRLGSGKIRLHAAGLAHRQSKEGRDRCRSLRGCLSCFPASLQAERISAFVVCGGSLFLMAGGWQGRWLLHVPMNMGQKDENTQKRVRKAFELPGNRHKTFRTLIGARDSFYLRNLCFTKQWKAVPLFKI